MSRKQQINKDDNIRRIENKGARFLDRMWSEEAMCDCISAILVTHFVNMWKHVGGQNSPFKIMATVICHHK